MSNKKKNLFYGSLRKGEYNYNGFVSRFGEEGFVYKGTRRIEGFELYSLGPYPVIVPEKGSTVVVDEFELSPEADASVRRMELGAGYSETEIDGCSIYFMPTPPSYTEAKVESGDWSEYLRRNNK